jgi:cysteine-rich repeat protein
MSDGLDLINTHNVLIDHVSVYNPGDEAMTIGSGTNAGIPSGYTHDITVQHSIFAYTYTGTHPTTSGIMIEYDPINNVSLHHNYIYNFKRRSPKFGTGGHYDFRNNVIAHADGWGNEGGTRLIADQGVNATGNILKNVYNANYGTAILVEDNDPWHISGNMYNGDTSFDDGLSNHAEYTNVPAITTLEVTEVQGHVFGCAGAFPRDGADQNLVGPPSQECRATAPASICGDGLVNSGESCDDGNATSCDGCSYPGCATETLSTWYLDADGDNRGDPVQTTLAYCIPIGYESSSLDCDDGDPQVYGGDGAPQEICDNGKDDDCAGGDALCGGGTDLTYEISASADDAGRQARGKFELYGLLRATAGNDYDRWSSGMRFTNVAIPQGALVSRASLEVSTRLYGGNPVDDANVEIYAEDVDNADAFSSSGNFAARVQTTASVSWVQKDMGAGPIRSPDISAVIQEVVNRPGWQSGNDLVILVKGHSGTGGVFEMHSIDTESAKKPKLHITINGGGGCSPDCTAPLCGQPDGCGNPCPTTDRDCNGVCGGSAVEDCAGECDGNAAVGCDDICSLSPAVFDECNVCGGDGSSCSGGSYDVLSDFGQPCRYACRDAGFAFDCDANATDANTIGGCPAGYEAKSVAGECGDINWNNCDRDHYAWQLLCRCID